MEEIDFLNKDSIEFMIISHPHLDHYSGILEILDYVHSKNIIINNLCHSFGNLLGHLPYVELDNSEDENGNTLLENIIEKIRLLDEVGLIKKRSGIGINTGFTLNSSFSLMAISPLDTEIDVFNTQIELFKDKGDFVGCSKLANLLSTVWLLSFDRYCLLFTSDVTFETLDRIIERNSEIFRNKKLILGQMPHHGSKENHNIRFWKQWSFDVNSPIVVSAGQNLKYKHPHSRVIFDFDELNFKIHATNHVNGLIDFTDSDSFNIMDKFDLISNEHHMDYLNGDQKFRIEKGFAITY
ncbi:MAG: hypothetical protein IPJ51_08395 [Saprospiraceae bacterium]|nr:hypothetical protein [Saprospiraceae bacterium]